MCNVKVNNLNTENKPTQTQTKQIINKQQSGNSIIHLERKQMNERKMKKNQKI